MQVTGKHEGKVMKAMFSYTSNAVRKEIVTATQVRGAKQLLELKLNDGSSLGKVQRTPRAVDKAIRSWAYTRGTHFELIDKMDLDKARPQATFAYASKVNVKVDRDVIRLGCQSTAHEVCPCPSGVEPMEYAALSLYVPRDCNGKRLKSGHTVRIVSENVPIWKHRNMVLEEGDELKITNSQSQNGKVEVQFGEKTFTIGGHHIKKVEVLPQEDDDIYVFVENR